MLCVFTGVLWRKMIQLLSNKTTPHFPLRVHEVPPLHLPNSRIIHVNWFQGHVLPEQQRRRPACVCAQSDQRLCYSLSGKNT